MSIRDLVTGKAVAVQITKGLWIPDKNATKDKEWHEEFKPHVEAIQKALDEWETGHMEERVKEIFQKCDRNIDRALEWNNSEVRSFIMEVFALHGIPPPDIGESHWYQLYAEFERNSDGKLDKNEAIKFAKFLHEEIAKKETDWKHLGHDAPLLMRKSNGMYQVVPQPATASNGHAASTSQRAVPPQAAANAHAGDWRSDISSVHVATAKATVTDWDKMDVQQKVHKLFGKIDSDGDGHLEWNNNEIRNLVAKVFEAEGLPVPKIPETVWYRMYRELDVEGTYNLSESETVEFVKRVYERILHFHTK